MSFVSDGIRCFAIVHVYLQHPYHHLLISNSFRVEFPASFDVSSSTVKFLKNVSRPRDQVNSFRLRFILNINLLRAIFSHSFVDIIEIELYFPTVVHWAARDSC